LPKYVIYYPPDEEGHAIHEKYVWKSDQVLMKKRIAIAGIVNIITSTRYITLVNFYLPRHLDKEAKQSLQQQVKQQHRPSVKQLHI